MRIVTSMVFCSAAALAACGSSRHLSADIQGKNQSPLKGEVSLTQTDMGVRIKVKLDHVGGPGTHGIHLHAKADCSATDASSAGEHWNPGAARHGMPDGAPHHLGDLGNIVVKENGKAELEITVAGTNLTTDEKIGLKGRALVIHAMQDDGETQPTGNSGDRIGCAEIK